MIITSVKIEGMHKIVSATYSIKDITYLVGNNGAGKSTVLQAIQLGLLGYIPGYARTNEGVFRHANGTSMTVTLTLSDGPEDIVITRTWVSAGGSVKSFCSTQPESFDVASVIADLELPIFNFSDFTSLSANKMKEWFISFLPQPELDIDWEAELNTAADGMEILDPDLMPATMSEISTLSDEASGVALVKAVNAYFKDMQSFLKGRQSSLNSTIESLVYYDDISNIDAEKVSEELKQYSALSSQLAAYDQLYAKYQQSLKDAEAISTLAASFEEDSEVVEINSHIAEVVSTISDVVTQHSEIVSKMNDIKVQMASLRTVAASDGNCPLTKTKCDAVMELSDKYKKELAELTDSFNSLSDEGASLAAKKAELEKDKSASESKLYSIRTKYNYAAVVRSNLVEEPNRPTKLSHEDIQAHIAELNEMLAKAAANRKYNELVDRTTKDKFVVDNSLLVIKNWAKLTDANGLQTKLMVAPFDSLADEMSGYLSKMFGKPISAKFNMSEKANSFSFGLVSDDKYIPFETLSSGEKCLYTIALLMCLTFKSSSPLKVLVIDDLLDHLDKSNAEYMFSVLSNVKDVQFILAGVQPCSIKSIITEVSEVN